MFTMCLLYNVRIQCPRFRMCVYTLCLALHGVYVYNVFPCTMCLRIQCAYSQRLLGLECVCIHNVFRSTPIPISIWVLSYACHNRLLHLQSRSTPKPSCMLLLLVFVLKVFVLQTEPLSISFSLSLAGMVHAVLVPSFGERYRIEVGPSISAQSSPELGRYFYFSSPSCLQCHSHCHDWLVCFCCFYPAQLKAFQACISHTMASWSTP